MNIKDFNPKVIPTTEKKRRYTRKYNANLFVIDINGSNFLVNYSQCILPEETPNETQSRSPLATPIETPGESQNETPSETPCETTK